MPLAYLVPGSASGGDFVARAFADVIAGYDHCVVTDPSGDALVIADRVAGLARDRPPDLAIGVSVGAHAVAWWASRHGVTVPCVLAMPAWTGEPGPVAGATAAAANQVARLGVAGELHRLRTEFGEDWVVAELQRAWSGRSTDALVATLQGTAASVAPGVADLAAIQAPAVVVALDDDPLHPASVAAEWAAHLRRATLVHVGRDEPADDIRVFGRRVSAVGFLAPAQPPAARPPEPPAAR